MTTSPGRRPLVVVLVPYAWSSAGLTSSEYDYPAFRAEVPTWFEGSGHEVAWQPVALRGPDATSVDGVVARLRDVARERPVVAFNLCDGAEDDGIPGISVVLALEAAGLPFTGAGSAFYRLSTSKLVMKSRFVEHGVPTAPWRALSGDRAAALGDCERLGFPLLVKPDVSAASVGIGLRSRVEGPGALDAEWSRLEARHPRLAGSFFAERFVEGPEYTAFVFDRPGEPEVFHAAERLFHPGLPPSERFLTHERYAEEFEEEAPPPPGHDYCAIGKAPGDVQARLAPIAARAFRAVEGSGYARVDVRMDASTGALFVLELNANCGLSFEEGSYTGQILRQHVASMGEVVERILGGARARARGGAI